MVVVKVSVVLVIFVIGSALAVPLEKEAAGDKKWVNLQSLCDKLRNDVINATCTRTRNIAMAADPEVGQRFVEIQNPVCSNKLAQVDIIQKGITNRDLTAIVVQKCFNEIYSIEADFVLKIARILLAFSLPVQVKLELIFGKFLTELGVINLAMDGFVIIPGRSPN